MEPVIRLENVWKTYGNSIAVRGLSLAAPPRSIYGFLGPNGAGKSTTIRMILGLQRPDRGVIRIFGDPTNLPTLARIGSLVESPSLYLHLTGRENLEVHRRLLGARKNAIDEALEIVGLRPVAGRAVRGYSSGMKQRLGIAQALLGGPELLLLDEPTNGLDPAGSHEIRTLIRTLPERRGVTIFVSSHLLAEVEQVGTHFAIISEGQVRFEGAAEELRIRSRPAINVEVDDAGLACRVLSRAGIVANFEARGILKIDHHEFTAADINAMLVREGVAVSRLALVYPTLEEAFLKLTCSAPSNEVTYAHGA
jgi:lantibiotic transport system ATP-binding protein